MTPRSPPLVLALLVGSVPTLSARGAAAAAEVSAPELAVARRLFDEGKAAEDAGQYGVAAEKFRRAAGIKDTPGLRFHLGRCEEEQGAYVEALLEYDRARDLIDGGVKAADVAKLLPAARERVRAKLAQLTIKLPDDLNARVELDGKTLSSSVLGVAMPINPGTHRLSASASGHRSFAAEVELASGEARQFAIELAVDEPVPGAAPPAPAPAPAARAALKPEAARATTDSSVDARTVVLVSEATLFAAGVTTGIVFTMLRGAANRRYDTANQAVLAAVGGTDSNRAACAGDDPPPACTDLRQAGEDRSHATGLAAAGFIGAGVSAAAFGLTYWLWPEGKAPAKARAQLGPGELRFAISGRF